MKEPPDRSDERLMRQVAGGEPAALALLFERHHRRLWKFFRRTTGAREAADELTQEVFLRMLRYRKSFRRDGSFVPWMYRMARNLLADHLRRGTTEPGPSLGPGLDPECVPGDAPSADTRFDGVEERRSLERAFRNLPAGQREILVLARFQGLSHREIADLLGCSTGAVKLRVFRALRALERELEKEDAEARRRRQV